MYGIKDNVYEIMNRTKEVKPPSEHERYPYISLGKHTLAVLLMELFESQTYGPMVRLYFEVLQSDAHQVGERVAILYKIGERVDKAWKVSDADRFGAFLKALKNGGPEYNPAKDTTTLLVDRTSEQLARGMVVGALAVNTSKKPGKVYTEVVWSHIPQTPDQIRAMRARLEGPRTPVQAAPIQTTAEPARVENNTVTAQPMSFLSQVPDPNKGGFPY